VSEVREAALVLPSFASGGAERVVLNLAHGLARAGVSVRLLALDGDGPLRPQVDGSVRIVDIGHLRARWAGPALLAELRRRPADVVVGSQTHVNALLALLRPLLPRATRLVLRAPALRPDGARDLGMGERLIGRLLGRADLLLASSTEMVAELRRGVVARTPIVLIANPVDVLGLRAGLGPEESSDVSGDVGDHHPLRVVTVGRLVDGKGHEDLFVAAARCGRSVRLALLGDGPLRGPLEQRAERLGIADRIRLLGRIDDPRRLARTVASADLLVHPSRREGMPNAVLEALALGTPVLATTDLTMLTELAEEVGPASLRLVPRDRLADALADATSRSEGPVPRPSLLPERFTVEAVIATLLDALDALDGLERPRGA